MNTSCVTIHWLQRLLIIVNASYPFGDYSDCQGLQKAIIEENSMVEDARMLGGSEAQSQPEIMARNLDVVELSKEIRVSDGQNIRVTGFCGYDEPHENQH